LFSWFVNFVYASANVFVNKDQYLAYVRVVFRVTASQPTSAIILQNVVFRTIV